MSKKQLKELEVDLTDRDKLRQDFMTYGSTGKYKTNDPSDDIYTRFGNVVGNVLDKSAKYGKVPKKKDLSKQSADWTKMIPGIKSQVDSMPLKDKQEKWDAATKVAAKVPGDAVVSAMDAGGYS